MKYIKTYYDKYKYFDILNYFCRLFIIQNSLNISENDFYDIFNNLIYKLTYMILNNELKTDKKLFNAFRDELIFLIENNDILKSEIERQKIYSNVFRSDKHSTIDGIIDYDFFRLSFKDKSK